MLLEADERGWRRNTGTETELGDTLSHTHTIKGRVTEKRDLDTGGEVGTDRIEYQPYFMLKGKRVRLKVGGVGSRIEGGLPDSSWVSFFNQTCV